MIIAKNIYHRRQVIGLSQEVLADNCDLHRTYIGSIERGERNLTVNTLARIAKALGCTAADLLTIKNSRD
ncbi:helix-turn-helix domain-containing protein [Bombella sp. TMW 2.2543]|uniref:Helix-turn-helix domain-containing protein n=1 Tax=Bombella pluederhausensis TaxID=2967336 RepID=A0ABT3WHS5_9PROT|nr:helix-turn-helix transcriptional regulator [Bombella pluederhausensis]MCX5618672.1 helix-turn-helix domain-containing protein [Bombella pluederhausensis]